MLEAIVITSMYFVDAEPEIGTSQEELTSTVDVIGERQFQIVSQSCY